MRLPAVTSFRLIAVSVLSLVVALNAQAQTPLPKPPINKPTVLVGPASLSARSMSRGEVYLSWPPVAGAAAYRLTRIENTGDPEATLAVLPATSFSTQRSKCDASWGMPGCVFDDVSRVQAWIAGTIPDASSATPINGSIYPHSVTSGKLYTYRVWALFANGVVSPPSPPATVQVQ
jgi:hypothetical protein